MKNGRVDLRDAAAADDGDVEHDVTPFLGGLGTPDTHSIADSGADFNRIFDFFFPLRDTPEFQTLLSETNA